MDILKINFESPNKRTKQNFKALKKRLKKDVEIKKMETELNSGKLIDGYHRKKALLEILKEQK